jgi:hypothetical protein
MSTNTESPLNQEQINILKVIDGNKSSASQKSTPPPPDEGPQLGYDLSRSYGRNWTQTNVQTLFDWISVAAFNMLCLDYAIERYRATIRNFTIYGLVVSTLSGTISLSQFGIEQGHIANRILQGIFTFFTFSLAIYTGYVKIYQIQERLEQFIKLRQDWAIFATTIGSELQLPIQLRRDALHLIVKYKSTYLDLIKIDIEVPESLRIRAEQSLPKSADFHIQVTNLPCTIVNIGIQELDDLNAERKRDKDRYSVTKSEAAVSTAESLPPLPKSPLNSMPPSLNGGGAKQKPGASRRLSIQSRRDVIPPATFTASVVSPVAAATTTTTATPADATPPPPEAPPEQ